MVLAVIQCIVYIVYIVHTGVSLHDNADLNWKLVGRNIYETPTVKAAIAVMTGYGVIIVITIYTMVIAFLARKEKNNEDQHNI